VTLPRAQARTAIARTFERFPLLAERRAQRADTLSGGEGQLLMIARALIASPVALLVDEPFQGLSAEASEMVLGALRAVADGGASVLIASPEPLRGIESIRINHGSTVEVLA
jgi:branched-chain amino acid transport system ATP-binding protein